MKRSDLFAQLGVQIKIQWLHFYNLKTQTQKRRYVSYLNVT